MPQNTDALTTNQVVKHRPIVIRVSGRLLDVSPDGVSPLEEDTKALLTPHLSFEKKRALYGRERYNFITGTYDRRMEIIPKKQFTVDKFGRLIALIGLYKRIHDVLDAAGYNVEVRVCNLPRERLDWDKVDLKAVTRHFEFRQRQEECLQSIFDNPYGIIHATTGFGKLVIIAMACLAYPNAKIDVVTRRATLVNKINKYLTRYVPNVGQVGAGGRHKGRVTVYTFKSLGRSEFDADIVLVDEAHEGMSDEASSYLAQYQHAQMYALSASPFGRLDGTDMRMEAIFGQTIFYLPYKEALQLGLVVPIRVEWSDVRLDRNPCAGLEDVHRKRHGLWRNHARNQIIADKARTFTADDQVLITVDFVEHAVHLWQHLKNDGYVLVYDKMNETDLRRYKRDGLLPQDYKVMDPRKKERYRELFEANKLKKAISTVWDVGIDPVWLTALIRADAGDSSIDDTQIPGRAARVSADNPHKVGVVCDFRDQFDPNYEKRAKHRMGRYKAIGWEQVLTTPTGGLTPLRTG